MVNTAIERDGIIILRELGISTDAFRGGYKKTHGIHTLPLPAAALPAPPLPLPTAPIEPPIPNMTGPFSRHKLESTTFENIRFTNTYIDTLLPEDIRNETDFEVVLTARSNIVERLIKLVQNDYAAIEQHRRARTQFGLAQATYTQQSATHNTQLTEYSAATQTAIRNLDAFRRLTVSTFATTVRRYLDQVAANTRALELKKLEKESSTEPITAATDMVIDTEPPATMKNMEDLINKLIRQQMKPQRERAASQQAKNSKRSQPGGSNRNNTPARGRRASTPDARRTSTPDTRRASTPEARNRRGSNTARAPVRRPGRANDTRNNQPNNTRRRSRSETRSPSAHRSAKAPDVARGSTQKGRGNAQRRSPSSSGNNNKQSTNRNAGRSGPSNRK